VELSIPVWMGAAFARLAIALKAVAGISQQSSHCPGRDRVALTPEFLSQLPNALAGPAQWRFWITARRGFDQCLQRLQQPRVFLRQALATAARTADALAGSCSDRLCHQLGDASANGVPRQTSGLSQQAD